MTPLIGHYQLELVALSVIIAILAAAAALDLAGRVTATRGRAQAAWLAGGAFAMGLGIWSMHYTGMLALHLPVDVTYHVPTVLLSLLAAILASAVALFLSSRERLGAWRIAAGSAVMGSGIAGMHYIGMAAMRLPATVQWSKMVIGLSIVIAVTVSGVALWLAFRLGHAVALLWTRQKATASIVMGLAVATMHYTGMAAARFVASAVTPDRSLAVDVTSLGVAAIVAVTLTVLLLAIATSVVDRRIRAEREQAAERQGVLVRELQTALAEVKVLRGILPICADCKRVRTEDGGWDQIESYVRTHTNAEFSHGLCPDCAMATWGVA